MVVTIPYLPLDTYIDGVLDSFFPDMFRVSGLVQWSDHGRSPNYGPKQRQMRQLASCWVAQFCVENSIPPRLHYKQRPTRQATTRTTH